MSRLTGGLNKNWCFHIRIVRSLDVQLGHLAMSAEPLHYFLLLLLLTMNNVSKMEATNGAKVFPRSKHMQLYAKSAPKGSHWLPVQAGVSPIFFLIWGFPKIGVPQIIQVTSSHGWPRLRIETHGDLGIPNCLPNVSPSFAAKSPQEVRFRPTLGRCQRHFRAATAGAVTAVAGRHLWRVAEDEIDPATWDFLLGSFLAQRKQNLGSQQ